MNSLEAALQEDRESLKEVSRPKLIECIFIHTSDRNFIVFFKDCKIIDNTIKCDKVYSKNDINLNDLDNNNLFVDKTNNEIYKKYGQNLKCELDCYENFVINPEYYLKVFLIKE